VLEIHGTADPVVPYNGREEDDYRGSVPRWLEDWVERDRCVKQPRTTAWSSRVARLDWTSCSGGAAVSHLRISGGLHQWPGATPPDRGPQVGLSSAQEIWRFLADKRLPA
jgi:poly(3-hydroxybutyrate) depolymerase